MKNENGGLKRNNRGLGKEDRAVHHDSRKNQKMVQKYQEGRALGDALWSTKNKDSLGGDPCRLHARRVPETILPSQNLLRDTTSLAVDEFEWLCKWFAACMGRMCRSFQKRAVRMQEAGAAGIPHVSPAGSHPAVSRGNQRRVPVHHIRISPVCNQDSEEIPACRFEDNLEDQEHQYQEGACPDHPGQTIILDGSHVEIERPTRKDRNDAYSGSRFTLNTNFLTNVLGVIISISIGLLAPFTAHDFCFCMFCSGMSVSF